MRVKKDLARRDRAKRHATKNFNKRWVKGNLKTQFKASDHLVAAQYAYRAATFDHRLVHPTKTWACVRIKYFYFTKTSNLYFIRITVPYQSPPAPNYQ